MKGRCAGCGGWGQLLGPEAVCGACAASATGQDSLLALLEGPGQAGATDPPTSRVGGSSPWLRWKDGSARLALLCAFGYAARQTAGSAGSLTDEEACERAGLDPRSEYATRCSELRRLGLIAETGQTRRGSSGVEQAVSMLTPFGARALEELGQRRP